MTITLSDTPHIIRDESGFERIRSGFIPRVPGVDANCERYEALARLLPVHRQILAACGVGGFLQARAEQVHGHRTGLVDLDSAFPIPDVDGLMTAKPGICLGIYVADCAAVFLYDRQFRGISLVHSGRKGTGLGIVPRAVEDLCKLTGGSPEDVCAWVSPCIRPPHYEIDFARIIVQQLAKAGVEEVIDSEVCTATQIDSFYSYRRELGKTGRMLAWMALT